MSTTLKEGDWAMRSVETELAIIHEKLKEIDKLDTELTTLKTAYQVDRVELQSLLRLIASLKNLLMLLATTILGAIATTIFSRYK